MSQPPRTSEKRVFANLPAGFPNEGEWRNYTRVAALCIVVSAASKLAQTPAPAPPATSGSSMTGDDVAPLARRASSSGEVSSPAERADQKQLEPDPPARRVSRHSCTAVASAHSGPGGWPPLSRILPTVTSGNGFPPSPARPPNPTAPGRQLSMRRIPFARQDSIGHAGGPPAPPFPILPLSPRTADGGTTSGGPGPPPKRPSWPRSSDTSDVYKQEEATYRLTLSGPKLKSHREVHGDTLVMHVDSSGISHLFVRRILEPLGYKIVTATDGQKALDMLSDMTTLPDIMLLDNALPGSMSAVQVCEHVRKEIAVSTMPIIITSPKKQDEAMVDGLRIANDYVRKPLRANELVARIETQLRVKDMWQLESEAHLLRTILPLSIIQRISAGQTDISDAHHNVTVLFSDVVGFTEMCSHTPTRDVVMFLNSMFRAFDSLVDKHDVYKVDMIGDAYFCICGHADEEPTHSRRMLNLAKDMLEVVSNMIPPRRNDTPAADEGKPPRPIRIRIGMHTGPVYAGVIGAKCPRYTFFGDTVNVASRMESHGYPTCIHISNDCLQELCREGASPADFVSAGERYIKGKGQMYTHLARAGAFKEALAAWNLPDEVPSFQLVSASGLSPAPSPRPSDADEALLREGGGVKPAAMPRVGSPPTHGPLPVAAAPPAGGSGRSQQPEGAADAPLRTDPTARDLEDLVAVSEAAPPRGAPASSAGGAAQAPAGPAGSGALPASPSPGADALRSTFPGFGGGGAAAEPAGAEWSGLQAAGGAGAEKRRQD